MKTRRFDFNFRPLQINVGFSIDGSVPDKQNFDADTGEYTPDYTITPLIIQPNVSRMDKDEFLAAGSVNHYLANVKWYEIVGGVRKLIDSTDTNYEITTSGGQAGRIKVKKNAQPKVPITLEFFAEYTDTRTNQIHTIQSTHIIVCNNSTMFAPQLFLDAADQTIYNPLTDPDKQTVHASLRLGLTECPAANRVFVWEIFRDDNTWTAVGDDTTLDYDVTVAADGASCTVDRSLMGTELHLRCRAKYDIGGNPSEVTLNDAAPCKSVAFVRRLPKYEFDITELPTNIPPGILEIVPKASIWDTNGAIANPEKVLLPLWYIATNKASGSLSYSQIGHGINPVLPTAAMSDIYGGVVGLDVKDTGPVCAWEDSDGSVFEDADGNIILIQ